MFSKKLIQKNLATLTLLLYILVLNGPDVRSQAEQNLFNDYLQRAESELGFSGSVLVMKDDSVLLAKGYGLADREKMTANTADTRFLLCSVTKQFTATAIMQLAERGLLSLDDPITKYVSAYTDSLDEKITIYNLLTQTSGIPDYLSLVDTGETFENPVAVEQVISNFMQVPPEFEPGSKWQYSNSNYYLLGRIIEVVSGMSYGDYVYRNIFEPLGMAGSGFPEGYLNDMEGTARGYIAESGGSFTAVPAVHSSWPFAAGGLYSTARDMSKWEKGLRNETVLKSESVARMFTPFKWRYGCGWEIDTLYGQPVASHGGTGGGYCSHTIRFVDRPVCVVVLSNVENAYRSVSKIAYELVAIMLGKQPEEKSIDTTVQVNHQILVEYAGDYELAPGVAISFLCRDGNLYTKGPGQPEIRIYPRNETEFFLKVTEGSVQFVRDSAGTVSGIVIHQGGREIKAERIR